MVLLEVHNGKPHQRPVDTWFTDSYWEFIVKCWDVIPHNRPTVQEIMTHVQNCLDTAIVNSSNSPPSVPEDLNRFHHNPEEASISSNESDGADD
jgi:serine/threonine protein kinase